MGHRARSIRECEMPCVVYCVWQQTFLSSRSDRIRVCFVILLPQKQLCHCQNFTCTFITAGFLASVAELEWGTVRGPFVSVKCHVLCTVCGSKYFFRPVQITFVFVL
jgi:hypothetical protein